MSDLDVTIYLCQRDPRSNMFEDLYGTSGWLLEAGESPPPPREQCYCDNCFYGRDLLAVRVLELEDQLEELRHDALDRPI